MGATGPKPISLRRNMLSMGSGTVAGQLALLLAAPILTRIYSPSEFGAYAVFLGLQTILGMLSTFRYELAIPLAKTEEDAKRLTLTTLLISIGFASVVGAVILFLIALKPHHIPQVGPFWGLLPVGIAATGWIQTFNFWGTRESAFRVLGLSRLLQNGSLVAFQIGLAFLPNAGFETLVLGHLAGFGTAVLFLVVLLRRGFMIRFHLKPSLTLLKEFQDMPKFTAAHNLSVVAGSHAPAILLAQFHPVAVAGSFLLMTRVLLAPGAFFGQAIGQVFYGAAAHHRLESDGHRSLAGPLARKLLFASLPLLAAMILAGPQIFVIAFGPEWRLAGDFARWLAPWYAIAFVTSPLSRLAFIKGRQRSAMKLEISGTALRLGGLVIVSHLAGAFAAVIAFGILGFIVYMVWLLWILRLADVPLQAWFVRAVTAFLLCLAASAIAVLVLSSAVPNALLLAALSAAIFAIPFILDTVLPAKDGGVEG